MVTREIYCHVWERLFEEVGVSTISVNDVDQFVNTKQEFDKFTDIK